MKPLLFRRIGLQVLQFLIAFCELEASAIFSNTIDILTSTNDLADEWKITHLPESAETCQ